MAEIQNMQDVLIAKMAENLPVLRKKLRLTQDDLAQIIGVTRYTVMLLETQKRQMKWSTFLSLVLLFEKNEDTAVLMRALGIYTNELEVMLSVQQSGMQR